MTDKKLYDKAEELFCRDCKLRTEQCLFAYRKVNGIEDCHKSCGCKEVPAWIAGYQKGLKVKINATTISDCPIKDEWHRLGKNPNDLPDEDVPVLCVRGGNIYVAWYSNNEWRGTRWEQVKKPYAWKEIELPKKEE